MKAGQPNSIQSDSKREISEVKLSYLELRGKDRNPISRYPRQYRVTPCSFGCSKALKNFSHPIVKNWLVESLTVSKNSRIAGKSWTSTISDALVGCLTKSMKPAHVRPSEKSGEYGIPRNVSKLNLVSILKFGGLEFTKGAGWCKAQAQRPPGTCSGCNSRVEFSRIVRLPSGAAVRWRFPS